MKTTVEKIIIANKSIIEFNGKQIPSKLAYWLSRFEDKTNEIVKSFEKTNLDLFKKYGEQIEGQPEGTLRIKKENEIIYNKEIEIIISQEEDIDIILNLSLFEGVEVTKNFFVGLGDFIRE